MRRILTLIASVVPFALAAQVAVGPDAPDMSITYDPEVGEFTFVLSNSPGSNNYGEGYTEWTADQSPDPYWRFQGYVIYQFRSPADADDSLHLVILDTARVKPILVVDKADTIFIMLHNLYSTGPDTCTAFTYALDNTGLAGDYVNSFDPFTTLGYFNDSTYCFLAVAFAYNTYHESTSCDTLQQVLFSRESATGALQAVCIDLATVGVNEVGTEDILFSPNPATDGFTLGGGTGARYHLRCVSMTGALVLDRPLLSGEKVDVSTWPSGAYHAMAVDAQGRSIRRTVIVSH